MNPTPLHAFRYPPEKWEAAKERAKERGETVTDVIARALDNYITED